MKSKSIILAGLIYALLIFFLMLLASILLVLWNRQNAIDYLKKEAVKIFDLKKEIEIPTLASIIHAHMTPKNANTSNEANFYVGPDPNNWIQFGTIDGTAILWRIIKSNEEGIKIIYEGKKNGTSNPVDNGRIKVNDIYGIPWDTTGGTNGSNKWERPADLKDILHNWYYNTLSKNDKYIAPIHWCIGASGTADIGYPTNPVPLAHYLATECVGGTYGTQTFQGKTDEAIGVGLIRASDYISTSNEPTCDGSYWTGEGSTEYNNRGRYCGIKGSTITNFLYKSTYYWWTLNARAASTHGVWGVGGLGTLFDDDASPTSGAVRPVLNLKSDILHSEGTGTLTNPYIVELP